MKIERKLELLNENISTCTRCASLYQNRIKTVPGEGNPKAKIVLLGEAPGQNESETGRPFVGKAGNLLNNIIVAMGWQREDLFILNVVKCQPPGNRVPLPQEVKHCRPYLDMQLKIIDPKYIICWGKTASFYLLEREGNIDHFSMNDFRGTLHEWHGKKVLCTFHPSYLLRVPKAKAEVWNDLQILKSEIEKESLSLQPQN
jgi:uracil-DNA glycosylase family 4